MIIKFKNETYQISWRHHVKCTLIKKNHAVEGTTCVVKYGIDKKEFGYSFLNPCDNYCKEKGRKVSYGRVLRNLFPKNLKARKYFWNKYLKNS